MKEGLFAERSYFKWGLLELQRRIEDYCESGYTEFEVMNMFIHEMNNFACSNPGTSVMFVAAAKAGEYALELYLSNKKKGATTNEPAKRKDKFTGWC